MKPDTPVTTRGSAIAEEPRDALRQLKYYGRFLTELLTRSSANPEEPCEIVYNAAQMFDGLHVKTSATGE